MATKQPVPQRIEIIVTMPALERALVDLVAVAMGALQLEQDRAEKRENDPLEADRVKLRSRELDLEYDRMRLQWEEHNLRKDEMNDRRDEERARRARAKANEERLD